MHSAILNATGCALLLSSFVTFVILLREGCKRKRRSPFYILSTSDVLSTAATAVALLIGHIEAGVRLNYSWQRQNDTYDRSKWAIENGHQLLLSRIREFGQPADKIDSNMTLTCDAKHVFMQYGMLFAPLTNALMSLLTLITQCNLNAACMKRRCEVEHNRETSDVQLEPKCCERETSGGRRKSLFERRNVNIIQRIAKLFKFRTSKEDDKIPAGFLVMSHWLVPFLTIATLYFADYNDIDALGYAEDIECAFESNFPVNDFYLLNLGIEDDLNISDPGVYTSLKHYHYVNGEAYNASTLDGTQVNQIVSKVQEIVRNVMTYMHNSTETVAATSSLDTSELQNVTSNKSQAAWSSASNGTSFDEGPEVLLFRDLLKNASDQLDASRIESVSAYVPNQNKNDEEKDTQYFTSTEANTIRSTTSTPVVENATSLSNNQIYADIMKRIQVANMQTMKKNHYNHLIINRHHGKQLEKNLKEDSTKLNPMKDMLLRERDRLMNVENKSGSRMINECLVSSKFLKLHLLTLSFAAYFLPILLCCVLQVRGRNICENTIVMMRGKAAFVSALLRGQSSEGNTVVANEDIEWVATTSGKKSQDSSERFDSSQEARDDQKADTRAASCENHLSHVDVPSKELLSKVDRVARILGTVKISLILGVLLWTPIFLGTLLKVFSCTHAPQWLTDTAFLGAISFGIVRNILNLNVIKIQELGSDDNAKENKIRPVI